MNIIILQHNTESNLTRKSEVIFDMCAARAHLACAQVECR